MTPLVLQPKGVRYDIDNDDHPGRWPWILIGVLAILLVLAGLWAFLPRLDNLRPSKRTQAPSTENRRTEAASARRGLNQSDAGLPASVPMEVRRLVDGAEVTCRADDLASARRRYLEILEHAELGAGAPFVERRLGEIGRMLVTTPRPMPEKVEYEVIAGDSVERIARRHGTTPELLMVSNEIRNPGRLLVGQRLRILNKPVLAITVNRATHELRLVLNGKFLKRYAIETDRTGGSPPGSYRVHGKKSSASSGVRSNDRQSSSPDVSRKAYGVRWISLEATGPTASVRGFCIRAAEAADLPGAESTVGSIRMRTSDLDELGLIVPDGTAVRIQE